MQLEARALSKKYSRGSREFYAVEAADLQIGRGEFHIIIGKSGSGKSTFLNMLVGLTTPTDGKVFYGDKNIWEESDKFRSKLRNQKIGFLPQGISALPTLNVIENVMLSYYLYESEGDGYGRAMLYLDKLGIQDLAEEYPQNLSGGELRRMLLARALINNPEILIVDEPTSDLDSENTGQVMELFRNIQKEGVAILMVSHELDTLKYADKVYTMQKGRLLEGNQLTLETMANS